MCVVLSKNYSPNGALPVIRKIAPIAQRHGFSVALYGGVLDRGESDNQQAQKLATLRFGAIIDLDLILSAPQRVTSSSR